MGVVLSKFPSAIDTHLSIPKTPSVAKLSESEAPDDYGYEGQNENSHSELHDAENRSIRAIEQSVVVDNSVSSHDHSDPIDTDYSSPTYTTHPNLKKGRKLLVQNTHVFSKSTAPFYQYLSGKQLAYPDTEYESVHHSLGYNDTIKGKQGVSGTMWNSKGLKFLSATSLTDISTIASLWDSRMQPVGTDHVVDYIAALSSAYASLKEKYESEVPTMQSNIADLQRRISAIESRMPSGNDTLAHGNINIHSGGSGLYTHDGDRNDDLSFS